MKKNKFIKLVVFALCMIIMLIMLGACATDRDSFLRLPEEEIREIILEVTPIGMNKEDVLNAINSNWDFSIGILNQELLGTLGNYGIFPVVTVLADWIFDENEILIDVTVFKDTMPL